MCFIPKSEIFTNMLNVANHQLDEILVVINGYPEEEIVEALQILYRTKPYSKSYLDLAVNDIFLDFDVTDLQYKISDYHRSMSGTQLCTRSASDLVFKVILEPKVILKTKMYQLKNMLEMLHEGESNILKAILEKNLITIYPNITHDRICQSLSAIESQ